jgi:HlyD family secretion protein
MLILHYRDVSEMIDVKVYSVQETGIVSSVTSNGKIEEIAKKDLFVEIPVRIHTIYVKEGEKVNKGQPLAELDFQDLELQLEQAKTNLEIEQLKFEKIVKEVYNAKVYDEKKEDYIKNVQKVWNEDETATYLDKDIAAVYQKKMQLAKLKVQELERKLQQYPKVLVSPISGIVTEINANKGSVVDSLKPIITVSDISRLQVKANIGEYYISQIKEGQKVEITGDAFEGMCYLGKVKKISPIAKQISSGQNTETIIEVIVDIIDEDTLLKPGYSAQVKIITDAKDNTLILPYEAVVQDEENNDIVYVVKNNRAYKRKVKTGAELELEIEIIKGLTKGEKVILNPPPEIKDGSKVRITTVKKGEI